MLFKSTVELSQLKVKKAFCPENRLNWLSPIRSGNERKSADTYVVLPWGFAGNRVAEKF